MDLMLVKGKARCIAINSSWQLAPWADALYACDGAWWRINKGCPSFRGLKITQDAGSARNFGLKVIEEIKGKFEIMLKPHGCVGAGGNSGFHALNLSVQFGCKKIILVGYDMSVADGIHWFGRHPSGLHNPHAGNLERWRVRLDGVSKQLKELGVTVINTSANSALQNYKKMSLTDALA